MKRRHNSYEYWSTNLKYWISTYFIIPNWFSWGGDSTSFDNSVPVQIGLLFALEHKSCYSLFQSNKLSSIHLD